MFNILETTTNLNSLLAFFSSVLNIIQIVIPILLILILSIDIGKAVISQDEEAISNTIRSAKNRIIACVAIFMLPTIVEVIFNTVSVSINLSEEEYNEILSSYKTVINYNSINASDNTKTNDIVSSLSYSIASKTEDDIKIKENIEYNFTIVSKYLTPTIFGVLGYSNMYGDDYKILYDNKEYTSKDKIHIIFNNQIIKSVVNNDEYVISTIELKNATINKEENNYNLNIEYQFKKNEKAYELELIKIEKQDTLDNYLKKIEKNENKGLVANTRYSSIKSDYYDYTKLNNLSNTAINTIRNTNINNIVMLNTYYTSAVVNKATGFFIGRGVIVTSWSYIQQSLMNGQTIIIHDTSGNTYIPKGIVSINEDLDIVAIKLNKEVVRSVTIGDYKNLQKSDPVIAVVSKTGYGLSTISGIVSSSNDEIVSLIPLSNNDWGSPLFNTEGQVIGMNTSKIVNSTLSVSSPTIYLKELQNTIRKTKFKDIKVQSVDNIKKEYFYTDKNKETIIKNIDSKIWNKYKSIGNIEKNIVLDLIKSSYYENIISLRYENKTSNYISTMSYANDFIIQLEKDGYKNTLNTNKKKVYEKNNDKVLIMEEFDYLIIILAKESII